MIKCLPKANRTRTHCNKISAQLKGKVLGLLALVGSLYFQLIGYNILDIIRCLPMANMDHTREKIFRQNYIVVETGS